MWKRRSVGWVSMLERGDGGDALCSMQVRGAA